MPGLAKSSAWSLRTSSLVNSTPDLSGAGFCGSAAFAEQASISARTTTVLLIKSSTYCDRGALGATLAGIVHPFEDKFAARLCHGAELHVGIGGDARAQLGAEHLGSVVAHAQVVDHVLRNRAPEQVEAKAGFHRMLDRDPDFDHLAALRLLRNLHARDHVSWHPGKRTR